jgi:YegS/Rv2252/BmrU family lipid kinase
MCTDQYYTFIFNPAADKGRAASRAEWLSRSLSGASNASLETTSYPGHAGEIARRASCGSSTLIACGGDGTVNEVVNAIIGLPVRIGVLPIGSANDFLKTLYDGRKIRKLDLRGFFRAQSRKVDLGRIDFGNGTQRYFVNSLGIGFTGRIARTVKLASWLRGELAYAHALFSVLLGYTPLKMHIKITVPGGMVELDEPVFAFSIANGRIEGGKFRIAPDADPCDGLLDVCILKAIPKWIFLGYVFKYLKGSQIDDRRVIYCKASAVDVTISGKDVMHMDGEVIEGVTGKLSITVASCAVDMLCES